jgi:hypothetical protein
MATRTAVAGASAATAEAAVARAAGVGVLHVLPPCLFFLSFYLFLLVVFTLFYFIKLFDTA